MNKNTSVELRSFLYPSDSEDDLDLDYGSATHGPPDCTVRPAATFVNYSLTLSHSVFLNKCMVLFGRIMNTLLKYVL